MKIWSALFTMGIMLIAACNSGAAQPGPTTPASSPTIATHTAQPRLTATTARPAAAAITATATLPATATLSATATRPAKATLPPASKTPPSSVQEDLKDEWRTVFNGSQILFASCELMYDTHIQYQEGKIDSAKAKSDLSVESYFFTIVYKGFINWADPSKAVSPFKVRLERDMAAFIELWEQMNSGDIGSPEVTDPLFETCSSLFETQNTIFKAVTDAGLTNESADALASEIEELLNDLYSSVRDEN